MIAKNQENDSCQIWLCDEEKVQEIQRELEGTEGTALIFKALADDTRVKVAYALSKTEMCVCDVARLIDASSNVASYHLRYLRNLGLAGYRKEGKMVYYFLTDKHLKNLVQEAFQFAKDRTHR